MVQKKLAFGAVLAPALLGGLAGLLLGVNVIAYWAVQVLAIAGGVLGGTEHAGWRPGLVRGVVSGAIFGAALLAVRALTGWDDTADLGSHPALEPLITAIAGGILGAIGGFIGGRRR